MTLTLRVATLADAEGIHRIYAPIVATSPISFELNVPDLAEMQERVAYTLEKFPWLVCADKGTIAGYAYASLHRSRAAYQWSVDVSVYVNEAYRRRAIGRALYTSLLAILAHQGFYQAFAGIALPNSGSVRLHEAVGFLPLGVYRDVGFKAGAWHDVGWWQLTLQTPQSNPSAPKPFCDFLESPALESALSKGQAILIN